MKNKDITQQTIGVGGDDNEVLIDVIDKEDLQRDVGKLLVAFYKMK